MTTQTKHLKQEEVRSEKVRNFLDRRPTAIVRYGSSIIALVFIIILSVVCFLGSNIFKGDFIFSHLIESLK